LAQLAEGGIESEIRLENVEKPRSDAKSLEQADIEHPM
jgi:hypothetical protein